MLGCRVWGSGFRVKVRFAVLVVLEPCPLRAVNIRKV